MNAAKKEEQKQDTILSSLTQTVKNSAFELAASFQDTEISYDQLDKVSDNIAMNLKKSGVCKGDIIALSIFNSTDLIIAIVAIWKSGGVYMPLDPNYPEIRIDQILNESGSRFLISDNIKIQKKTNNPIKRLTINELKKNTTQVKLPIITGENLAYLIFTSGSTGKPKGILVDHNALFHAAKAYSLLHPRKFRVLFGSSISFDPSILMLVFCLYTGGSIHLYENTNGLDKENPEDIIKLIKLRNIDFILCTPTIYRLILNANQPVLSLKNVDLCGEQISKHLIERHTKIAPNATLYNAYGPSEYAIGATAGLLFHPQKNSAQSITIGSPLKGNKIYILNENHKRMKYFEIGEICIGGPGLAKGYLNMPALTNEKFINIELEIGVTEKLYKTGDMGYQQADGNFVFVGRKDYQVKINGHRVEIEEIEKIIQEISYIEACAVIPIEKCSEELELHLFYKSKHQNIKNQLLKDLDKKLPKYMIPRHLTNIEVFPMTENGKINRAVLKNSYYS